MDQLVHAARPERRPDDVGERGAGVDVGDELGLALGGVRAFPQEDDLGLLYAFLFCFRWGFGGGGGRHRERRG